MQLVKTSVSQWVESWTWEQNESFQLSIFCLLTIVFWWFQALFVVFLICTPSL